MMFGYKLLGWDGMEERMVFSEKRQKKDTRSVMILPSGDRKAGTRDNKEEYCEHAGRDRCLVARSRHAA